MSKQTKNTSKQASSLLTTITPEYLSLDSNAQKAVTPRSFALCVRSLLQNWRQGTVGCKGRSDVAYANRKPWKQKGTGRARAGSARSPLWRGGGVTFGPQPRTRTIKAGRGLKQQVMNNLLFQQLYGGHVASLQWTPQNEKPRTAQAHKVLKEAGLIGQPVVLFLPTHDVMAYASFANIPGVRVLFFDQPNVFDLAKGARWIFLHRDADHFKSMVSRWI